MNVFHKPILQTPGSPGITTAVPCGNTGKIQSVPSSESATRFSLLPRHLITKFHKPINSLNTLVLQRRMLIAFSLMYPSRIIQLAAM